MAIGIEDLEKIDFSDVATGESLEAVAPGHILLHEFMQPMSLSANALSKAMKVPANRITGIINGTRNITADTALRLQAALGVSASFWLGIQSQYSLERAIAMSADSISTEVQRLAA